MASATLTDLLPRYPAGTVLTVYNRRDARLGGTPVGSPIATTTVQTDGTATVTGLLVGRPYSAYSPGTGLYVSFSAEDDEATPGHLLLRFDGESYPARGSISGIRIWVGPDTAEPPEYIDGLDVWLREDDLYVPPHTHPTTDVVGLDAALATALSSSGGYQKFTADGTFTRPTNVTRVRCRIVAPGGGGGGGGTAAGTQLQAGGGGGGAGGVWEGVLDLTSAATVTCVVGTRGTGGTGGAAAGNAGQDGTSGGQASVAGTAILGGGGTQTVAADGGGLGRGSTSSSTTAAAGGQYSRPASTSTSVLGHPGSGGQSNQGAIPIPPGVVGGAGGGAASTTNGGAGGAAQTAVGMVSINATGSGGSSNTNGGNGAGATVAGCGGAGGGGGANGTGTGGNGGQGGPGQIEMWW